LAEIYLTGCRLRTLASDLSSNRFNSNDGLIRAVKDEKYDQSMARMNVFSMSWIFRQRTELVTINCEENFMYLLSVDPPFDALFD
jgi:hypothetical protein